ncbi:MAG: DapH/DapD/GlmU-related protein [Pseudomonadota bacterium]
MPSHARTDGGTAAAPLLIFPCNGNAIEALDCLGEAWRLVAVVDDTPGKQGPSRFGHPVRGREALREHADARVLAVPGSPRSFRRRRDAIESLGLPRERYACVVHPSARVSPLASVGSDVLLMAGVVVTANAVIGDHVCILPNTVVHHDATIGDWTLVGSNVSIAGGARLGANCYVGSGSRLIDGVEIGDRALVGLGSTVIRSVPVDAVVAGNPARRLVSHPGQSNAVAS